MVQLVDAQSAEGSRARGARKLGSEKACVALAHIGCPARRIRVIPDARGDKLFSVCFFLLLLLTVFLRLTRENEAEISKGCEYFPGIRTSWPRLGFTHVLCSLAV